MHEWPSICQSQFFTAGRRQYRRLRGPLIYVPPACSTYRIAALEKPESLQRKRAYIAITPPPGTVGAEIAPHQPGLAGNPGHGLHPPGQCGGLQAIRGQQALFCGWTARKCQHQHSVANCAQHLVASAVAFGVWKQFDEVVVEGLRLEILADGLSVASGQEDNIYICIYTPANQHHAPTPADSTPNPTPNPQPNPHTKSPHTCKRGREQP